MPQILTRTTITEASRLLCDYIKVGEISSIDPVNHTARVVFPEDDNCTTYDLPVLCRSSLKNHDYAMPDVGEDALCIFLPGGAESGFVLGSFYAGDVKPPAVDPDQRMIEFQDGTIIRYDRGEPHALDIIIGGTSVHIDRQSIKTDAAQTQSHSAGQSISTDAGATVTVSAGTSITLKAPQIVLDSPNTVITGNLTQGGTGGGAVAQINGSMQVSGDVVTKVSLNNHTHTGVHGETSGPH